MGPTWPDNCFCKWSFIWNTAMPVDVNIVYSCLCAAVAGLGGVAEIIWLPKLEMFIIWQK